ncbi:MAG: hypothetical protein VX583_06140 [Bdellovibrionota bacterium]|nr:hypothetical protein [Pseudobdellovibrionaceae bacterium]
MSLNLRARLREETKKSHQSLEESFPFCNLMKEEGIEQSSNEAFYRFHDLFFDYLKKESDGREFYADLLNVFEKASLSKDRLLQVESREEKLAMEYLLLGSRMGNRLLLSKNPKIKECSFAAYFEMSLPANLWEEFILKLDEVKESEAQDRVIHLANHYFNVLKSPRS